MDCRKTAYLSLVRSILDYGSIIWDPYQVKDIEKLEHVQRQAARFITNDYQSREEGCVTGMLQALELSSLEKHRIINRLIFMYKVVEGLVPAIPPPPPPPPKEFLKPAKTRRQIKGKQFKDHVSHNIIDRHIINNNRGFIVENYKTEQLKNSFFVKTVIEWNHLSTETVRAKTVESFKQALSLYD